MQKVTKIIIAPIIFFVIIFTLPKISIVKSNNEKFISPLPHSRIDISVNSPNTILPSVPTPTLIDQPVNILLLGLDARKGDGKPRCDAIQMLSFNIRTNTITITSVPRGTKIDIPNTDESSSYLANSCHIVGIDFAIKNIERITGLHPNYIVRIGFSQTVGVLRNLGIPTNSSLQFLRNRSVAYGDYQRTHNQALFIKDMLIKHLSTVISIPKPLKYILYRMIDTNMPYETAVSILDKLVKSEIDKHPERINLITKPYNSFDIKDIQFDENKNKLNSDPSSDSDYQNYQNNLVEYLEHLTEGGQTNLDRNNLSTAYKLVYTSFIQRIWEQIDNGNLRNEYHFKMLEIFALSSQDKNRVTNLVLDFITEMDSNNQPDYKSRGEELLKNIGV